MDYNLINAAELAPLVEREVSWLMNMVAVPNINQYPAKTPIDKKYPPLFHGSHVARQILRIEVMPRLDYELRQSDQSRNYLTIPHVHDQPATFCGVSYYVVQHSLANGFRIINPFRLE